MNCEHICLYGMQYVANGNFSDQQYVFHLTVMAQSICHVASL